MHEDGEPADVADRFDEVLLGASEHHGGLSDARYSLALAHGIPHLGVDGRAIADTGPAHFPSCPWAGAALAARLNSMLR